MASLSRDLTRELECPVCLQYLTLPITLCNNGHSICQNCRHNVASCPTCREEFTNVRCRAFESLVKGLRFNCKHQSQGCKEILSFEEIGDHEKVCPVAIQRCPLNKFEEGCCAWKGYFSDFILHAENGHKDVKVWRQPSFASKMIGKLKTVIFCSDEIFLYYTILDDSNVWNFIVMMLGSKKQASHYKTIFNLSGVDGVSGMVVTHAMRSVNENLNDVIEDYLCLRLDERHAQRYIQDNKFKLTISISKIT